MSDDDLEEVADAAELFVRTYYGDHEGRAWTVQGALGHLEHAILLHSLRKGREIEEEAR